MSNKKRILSKIKQIEQSKLTIAKIKLVNKIHIIGYQLHLAKLKASKRKSLLF